MFEALVAEAEAVSVDGWDFSWLDGRATEARPSWGYQGLLAERLGRARAALDLETGGGEVLGGCPSLPPLTAATESWPPNIAKASARLPVHGRAVPGQAPAAARADRARRLVRGPHDPVPHRGPEALTIAASTPSSSSSRPASNDSRASRSR